MAQSKWKPSSNKGQDFSNHFMSLGSETQSWGQSKFSASTSLTETKVTLIKSLGLQIYLAKMSVGCDKIKINQNFKRT